ncbi:MAG: indole-3-glycerol phosphate synthase TrpC [Elusimicrobia bacterium]|nr:indole-3-glycerol phosphate synthase TrpC [Elusimicrobiota bacterium]
MTRVLDRIVFETRQDLARKRAKIALVNLERLARRAPTVRPFAEALKKRGVGLVAELKAKSPSAGLIRPRYDVAAGARAYARAGARALSVLTEPRYFGGKLDHLVLARRASGLPVLRKDFIVDPYQVFEARAHGADAVLLIVRLLTDWELVTLQKLAWDLKMDALVETHTAEELGRAKKAGARLIGINSRNLDTLAMDPQAFEKLVPRAPRGAVLVAESGIKTPDDVRRLSILGVNAMLVGESLLKQKNLETAARVLATAGKA